VDLPPAELAAIVAELEAYPDFPTPVRGRCALCSGPLAAGEADRTGAAHAECARLEMEGIADQEYAEWVESMERNFGAV
jgi:hypothetical protein